MLAGLFELHNGNIHAGKLGIPEDIVYIKTSINKFARLHIDVATIIFSISLLISAKLERIPVKIAPHSIH